MPIELIFLYLTKLSSLVGLATNSNRSKSKSFSNNYKKNNSDMSDGIGSKELMPKKQLGIKEELKTEKVLKTEEKFGIEDLGLK